jgi:hypothetical protein
MITDQGLVAAPAAPTGHPGPGRDAITAGTISAGVTGSGVVRLKLICPSTSEVWDTPANAGFDRAAIVARLDALRTGGHDYELIDGDPLSDQERSDLYGQALIALARTGSHYRIRQVFGSRRHGGGDHLGSGVPALLVFKDGEPVDVYPHQADDGYETIRAYLDAL